MRRRALIFVPVIAGCILTVAGGHALGDRVDDHSIPPLPEATSNNAVAYVETGGDRFIASFNGIGKGLGQSDIHARTWVYSFARGRWEEGPDVPGGPGRLASVAVSVGERAFVFGGYTVAEDGAERSLPTTHEFDPAKKRFRTRQDMPIAVDDAVAFVYRSRYVYLVSGWHDLGNVNVVQLYDTKTDRWTQASPWPGRSVFGHAGGSVEGQIVICDGVAIDAAILPRRFVAVDQCYRGRIDAEDPRRIDWWRVPPHPGPPCYRMAATGSKKLGAIVFTGGSANPYNYNGIGYDGRPSVPCGATNLFDLSSGTWRGLPERSGATMDHRGLLAIGGSDSRSFLTVGGIDESQTALARVTPIDVNPRSRH